MLQCPQSQTTEANHKPPRARSYSYQIIEGHLRTSGFSQTHKLLWEDKCAMSKVIT